MCEQYELEGNLRLVVVSDLRSLDKLGGELCWYFDSSLVDERQYELKEDDVLSLDVLSTTVDGKRLYIHSLE